MLDDSYPFSWLLRGWYAPSIWRLVAKRLLRGSWVQTFILQTEKEQKWFYHGLSGIRLHGLQFSLDTHVCTSMPSVHGQMHVLRAIPIFVSLSRCSISLHAVASTLCCGDLSNLIHCWTVQLDHPHWKEFIKRPLTELWILLHEEP